MHVGGQRFRVRRERLGQIGKGVILKGKKVGLRLRFEVDSDRSRLAVKMEPGPSMLPSKLGASRVRFQEEF